jgi:hypothetical protein
MTFTFDQLLTNSNGREIDELFAWLLQRNISEYNVTQNEALNESSVVRVTPETSQNLAIPAQA